MLSKKETLADKVIPNKAVQAGIVAALGVLGPPGTAKGFIDYAEDVEEYQGKIQDRIDKRMNTINDLIAERIKQRGKAKTYTADVSMLLTRLGNDEGSAYLRQAIKNDPSVAPDLVKTIAEKEKNSGVSMTSKDIVEAFTVLSTKSPSLLKSYVKEEDVLNTLGGGAILDDTTFRQAVKDLSITEATTPGMSIIQTMPSGQGDPTRYKQQLDIVNARFVEKTKQDQIKEGITATEREELGKLLGIYSEFNVIPPELKNKYGVKIIKEILDDNEPIFNNVLQTNKEIARILDGQVPSVEVKLLLNNKDNPQVITEFDSVYGKGAAEYFIRNRSR